MPFDTRKKIILLAVLHAVASGCASMTSTGRGTMEELLVSVDSAQYPAADGTTSSTASTFPRPLEPYLAENRRNGLRAQVLNNMEAGVVAMEIGAPEYANRLLDDAHRRIETVYADNPGARAARSNFVPEANKDFKGEPYERSMVGYYLGLSSAMMNNLEDARVSFRWGELQDTMSASETYQSDMALLNFLVGWVDQCNGRMHTAEEYYRLARDHNSNLKTPKGDHNLLLIAETGQGPSKYATGQHDEELRYQSREHGAASAIEFELGGRRIPGRLAERLHFQATTLGGRAVDKILAGKASFKENAEDVADAAATVAVMSNAMAMNSMLAGNNDQANSFAAMGGLSALISLGSRIAAEQAKPEADTRYWDNLPARVYVGTAKLAADTTESTIRFRYGNGAPPTEVPVKIQRTGNCFLAWGSDRGIDAWNPSAPENWASLQAAPTTGGTTVATVSATGLAASDTGPVSARPASASTPVSPGPEAEPANDLADISATPANSDRIIPALSY